MNTTHALAPSPNGAPQTDHREASDLYRGEICRSGGYRVAICKDGIQWLLQRQRGAGKAAGARWEGFRYFATRAALIRIWTGLGEPLLPELVGLPERIKREAV